MLVLRRRPGESILLGDDIEIEIMEINHAKVKIGIRAPRTLAVRRKEVLMIEEHNRAAARSRLDLGRNLMEFFRK